MTVPSVTPIPSLEAAATVDMRLNCGAALEPKLALPAPVMSVLVVLRILPLIVRPVASMSVATVHDVPSVQSRAHPPVAIGVVPAPPKADRKMALENPGDPLAAQIGKAASFVAAARL